MRNSISSVLLCLFVLGAFTSVAFGQSRFLENGQNGAEISAGFGSGDNYTSLSAGFGYSFGAKFDIGLGVSRSSFDDEVIGEDGSAMEFSPFALVSLVRPTETSIVGVELSAAYGFGNFSSDGLDFLRWDMSSTAFDFGANLYLKLKSSPTLTVYPIVGVDYVSVKLEVEDSYGTTEDETVDDIAFSVGVNLVFNNRFVLTPAFRTFDGNNSWGISAGLLIPGT